MADDESISMQARSKENGAPRQHEIRSKNIEKYLEFMLKTMLEIR